MGMWEERRKKPEGCAARPLPVGSQDSALPGSWGQRGTPVRRPPRRRTVRTPCCWSTSSLSVPGCGLLPAARAPVARRGSAGADRGQGSRTAGEMPAVWAECVCILGPRSSGNQVPRWREKSLFQSVRAAMTKSLYSGWLMGPPWGLR